VTTVVVAGAVANRAGNAGEAWVRMSWAVGLRRLGCHVVLAEQLDPGLCTDDAGLPAGFVHSRQRAWFSDVVRRFGFEHEAALLCGDAHEGLSPSSVADVLAEADLLVNISGHLRDEALLRLPRRRAYVDLDPGFTQLWHEAGDGGAALAGHDDYFTVGENVGRPGCTVPTGGLAWRPVRQPVVLDEWPVCGETPTRGFTTVASWRAPFGPPTGGGKSYTLKHHQVRAFVGLAGAVTMPLEMALSIDRADDGDRRLLEEHGWSVVDPGTVVGTPDDFRAYVQSSTGEFTCAQGVYVETASGWFSDRSVRYLASGRPAVVQDTGFGRTLPEGEGLLSFRTPADARRALEAIVADYERHAKAARALAEAEFDATVVLGRFLEQVDVAP